MSRRPAVQIEEEFDDDTDLPLPSAPLPNTGTRGPLIQELNIDYDDPPIPSPSFSSTVPKQPGVPPPAFGDISSDNGLGRAGMGSSQNRTSVNTVTDITPYKNWTCIYPIYIDAKRPFGRGQRRLSREKSVWWPLSKDIADAATKMGLKVLHEVNKRHPRDWENPGRVRIQWKVEGTGVPLNSQVTSKTRLLEGISMYIHHIKPENAPRPPYTSDPSPPPEAADTAESASASAKGKSKASSTISTPKARSALSTTQPSSTAKRARRHAPTAPHPHPSFAERVSHYSPALESGMLIDAVKAGMAAAEGAAAGPGGEGAEAGAGRGQGGQGIQQKGKRKVIRVRG